MYSSCGALYETSVLFSYMDERNEFTLRSMILALVHHGRSKQAFHLFEEMLCKGAVPDRLTFIAIITGCCSHGLSYLERGNVVYYLLVIFKLEVDVIVGNALITMYGRNDSLEDARGTFDIMPLHDVVSWNAVMTAYANKGHSEEAINLFRRLDLLPNSITFIAILTATASPSALEFGVHIHNLVLASKYKSDLSVSNALINMYSRCGSLKGAENTFDEMQERNTISWTTMLAVSAEHGGGIQAFQLFEQMLQECVMPSMVTSVTYLNLCTKKEALAPGKRTHARMTEGQRKGEVVVETALVNMYGKCGRIKMAHKLFDGMLERNVVSWGTIISINAQRKLAKEAVQLLQQMRQEGVLPDRVVYLSILEACASQGILNEGQQVQACLSSSRTPLDVFLATALLRLYMECDRLKEAENIFDSMSERNVFSWNAMSTGYLQIEGSELIFCCFNRMQQEAILPDDVTFVNIFSACGAGMKLLLGKWMHALFGMSGFVSNVILWNALVSMYGRCCNLREAQRVFGIASMRNTVSWNAVIAAFAQNGCADACLGYLNRMEAEGFRAENSTFSVLLSACSHGGLVDEAFHIFDSMIYDLGIKPQVDHFNCTIDLLARAGRLDEAEVVLKKMPCEFNFVSLMTLLAACRLQRDIDRGEHIAMRACRADPGNVAPLVVLSSIYAAVESCEQIGRDSPSIEGVAMEYLVQGSH